MSIISGLPYTKITEYTLYPTVQENIINIENITNVVSDLGDNVTPDLSVVLQRINDLEAEAQYLREVVMNAIDPLGELETTGL
jgi:hypothetical protein